MYTAEMVGMKKIVCAIKMRFDNALERYHNEWHLLTRLPIRLI
jgi:hypothetical protein